MREKQRTKAATLRTVKKELQQARKQMAKDFVEKKALIVEKLRELRTQNRSIEEIYKYTTDIILEEEDEEEDDDQIEMKSRSRSQLQPSNHQNKVNKNFPNPYEQMSEKP